ncbi:4-alpha-glucanotransferase [Bifidobacterium aquikefiricola]|uniref:4-alpha-glucanotransferase n=1 Tax=Bifidobacterium aquikefiricola TaxID=3059038 RepID=A0AB39U4Z7_9BIFI
MVHTTESDSRLARPLIRLANSLGIATSYIGQTHDYHEISDDVLKSVIQSMGYDASTDEKIRESLIRKRAEKYSLLIPPTILHIQGAESIVEVNTTLLESPTATITLEDGRPFTGSLRVGAGKGSAAIPFQGSYITKTSITLPVDIPVGYHTLTVSAGRRSMKATLICAPQRIPFDRDLELTRPWGWMAQLYSIRSSESWGIGDFEDLAQLLQDAKRKTGADFMMINPLHASEPVAPLTPSPYLPSSRNFLNCTYIRPESIEEYNLLDQGSRDKIRQLHDSVRSLNTNTERLDRDAMWRAKMPALWIIFKAGRSLERQQQFDAFRTERNPALKTYATWCLAYDKWGEPTQDSASWIQAFSIESPEVRSLCSKYPDTLNFYEWLEWIADEQYGRAQSSARSAGMRIGIMADLAVGVHALGSDVWGNPERYARGTTVGAPPDYFNQQGQNWSQPPFDPHKLAQTGYAVYRDMLHHMFAHAGALRIDHILGLFRLWWIPSGKGAQDGAYVHYDAGIMLGILAIEALRAHGVVVGEDLGIVPEYVRESLKAHGILGCVVEWFEQNDGAFVEPGEWTPDALASVNTHDMPPASGYLQFEQVSLRNSLNLLTQPLDQVMAAARIEQRALMNVLVDGGWIDREWLADIPQHEQDIVEGQYKALCASPCKLLAVSIADGVGESRTQNQPGTNNEYPNWRIPLADANGEGVPAEELFIHQRLQSLTHIMHRYC